MPNRHSIHPGGEKTICALMELSEFVYDPRSVDRALNKALDDYRRQYVMQGQEPAQSMHKLAQNGQDGAQIFQWLELYANDLMRFPLLPFALALGVLLSTIVVPLVLVAHFCCDHAETCLGRTRLCCVPRRLDKRTSVKSIA